MPFASLDIELEKHICCPGEVVRGALAVSCDGDISVGSLVGTLTGFEYTELSYPAPIYCLVSGKTTRHDFYTSEPAHLSSAFHLTKGQIEYAFEFQLPAAVPPTLWSLGFYKAAVSYELCFRLEYLDPSIPATIRRHGIIVNSSQSIDTAASLETCIDHTPTACYCIHYGSVQARMLLDSSSYAPTEPISIAISINTGECTTDARHKVIATLQRTFKLKDNKKEHTKTETIASEALHVCTSPVDKQMVWKTQLVVPRDTQPTLSTFLITNAYSVVVRVYFRAARPLELTQKICILRS